MNRTTWILVANGSQAAIFESRASSQKLRRVADLAEPRARLHERDIDTDRSGRSFAPHGTVRHAMGREDTSKHHLMESFAKTVAEALNRGSHEGRFDALMLMCEPRFLGLVRPELAHHTAERIVLEEGKNISEVEGHAAEEAVKSLLADAAAARATS